MKILKIIFIICSFSFNQDVFDGLSLFTPGGITFQNGTSTLLIDNDKIFYVKDDLTLDLITVQTIFFDKKNVIVKGIPDGINILSKQISGAYPGMQVKITN